METKMEKETTMSTQEKMEIHPRKRGALPMEWTEYEVRRDGGSDRIATFANESDANRFVAGEKAIEACRGWKKLHDEMIALGGDVKSLTSEQIAQFACDQALLINLTDSALSALPAEETKWPPPTR